MLATGSVPQSLPGLDLDGERVISSDDALRYGRVPSSVIILGGGVIGVEFASVWRSFGAEVTIVEMLPQLLPLEDESSAKLLQRAFRRRGIGFELGACLRERQAHRHRRDRHAGRRQDARRRPAPGRGRPQPGLGRPGLRGGRASELERGYVKVDEVCRTSVPTISAVGDLIATPQLAHVGLRRGHHGRRAGRRAWTSRPSTTTGVPRITYSDPEVASVGITSAAAVERGVEITEF